MTRSALSRRAFAFGALATGSTLGACSNAVGTNGASVIDARVDTTLEEMYRNYPTTVNLAEKANGMLVMPLITDAGFGFGGAYGQGALRISNLTVDYYSAAKVTGGFQIGAQQYSHVLFFMTDAALANFRSSSGWEAGGDVAYVISDIGEGASASTTVALAPVVAVVFARAGLKVGATVQGTKYTRIIP